MQAFILTEGGKNIGFGHMTRCLSVAQALADKGIAVTFIVEGDESIAAFLKNKKYHVFPWRRQEKKLFEIIKNARILIIDSYLADVSLYKKLAQLTGAIVYFDDNKRLSYPGGFVVNGSLCAKEFRYPQGNGRRYLLGVKYAPLRKEFWTAGRKKINREVKKVLVLFGGSDFKSLIPSVVKLLNAHYPHWVKNIVIGRAFRHSKDIKCLENARTIFVRSPDVSAMKELMRESDLAISAGGQTLYELAKMGVPTVVVAVAKNQFNNIKGWARKGFIEYAGWYEKKDLPLRLLKCIKTLSPYSSRWKRSRLGQAAVDGKGPSRIVEAVLSRLNQ